MTNPHPSDGASQVSITLTETVQSYGQVYQQERQTVQDISKLRPAYSLAGDTQSQKLESFRQWVASNRVFDQLTLLAYVEDILSAPTMLETYEIDPLTLHWREEGGVMVEAFEVPIGEQAND